MACGPEGGGGRHWPCPAKTQGLLAPGKFQFHVFTSADEVTCRLSSIFGKFFGRNGCGYEHWDAFGPQMAGGDPAISPVVSGARQDQGSIVWASSTQFAAGFRDPSARVFHQDVAFDPNGLNGRGVNLARLVPRPEGSKKARVTWPLGHDKTYKSAYETGATSQLTGVGHELQGKSDRGSRAKASAAATRATKPSHQHQFGGNPMAVIYTAPSYIRNNDVEHEYRPGSDMMYLTAFDEPRAFWFCGRVPLTARKPSCSFAQKTRSASFGTAFGTGQKVRKILSAWTWRTTSPSSPRNWVNS